MSDAAVLAEFIEAWMERVPKWEQPRFLQETVGLWSAGGREGVSAMLEYVRMARLDEQGEISSECEQGDHDSCSGHVEIPCVCHHHWPDSAKVMLEEGG